MLKFVYKSALSRFNRTFMELKYNRRRNTQTENTGFNRTFMELKFFF